MGCSGFWVGGALDEDVAIGADHFAADEGAADAESDGSAVVGGVGVDDVCLEEWVYSHW